MSADAIKGGSSQEALDIAHAEVQARADAFPALPAFAWEQSVEAGAR